MNKTAAIFAAIRGGGREDVTQPTSLPKLPLRSRTSGRNYLTESLAFTCDGIHLFRFSYGEDN